jgi:hypothetical protein
MRIIVSVLGTLLILSVGCSSQSGSGRSAVNREHPIIRTLATRDRNAVHVALWTLQQNGITNFQAISFDDPYSEVQPTIRKVCETLKALPDERLSALDQILTNHWQIYSPIWSSHDWP